MPANNAQHRRQPQAPPGKFGGKKRIEHPGTGFGVHSRSGVGHLHPGVAAGRKRRAQFRFVRWNVRRRRNPRANRNGPLFFSDGLGGVGDQVHQHLAHLGRIGVNHRRFIARFHFQRRPLPQKSPQKTGGFRRQIGQIHRPRVEFSTPRVGQQLICQIRQPTGGRLDLKNRFGRGGIRRQVHQGQFNIAHYALQEIVEIVGHPARQHAQAFQLLDPLKPLVHLTPGFEIPQPQMADQIVPERPDGRHLRRWPRQGTPANHLLPFFKRFAGVQPLGFRVHGDRLVGIAPPGDRLNHFAPEPDHPIPPALGEVENQNSRSRFRKPLAFGPDDAQAIRVEDRFRVLPAQPVHQPLDGLRRGRPARGFHPFPAKNRHAVGLDQIQEIRVAVQQPGKKVRVGLQPLVESIQNLDTFLVHLGGFPGPDFRKGLRHNEPQKLAASPDFVGNVSRSPVIVAGNQPDQLAVLDEGDGQGRRHSQVLHIFDVNGRNGAEDGKAQVQRLSRQRVAVGNQWGGRGVDVGDEPQPVGPIQGPGLLGNVRGRIVETQVGGQMVLLLLGHDGAVPVVVELVQPNPVETGQPLDRFAGPSEKVVHALGVLQPDQVPVVDLIKIQKGFAPLPLARLQLQDD